MRQIFCLLLLVAPLLISADRTTNNYLSPTDERLQRVFLDGVRSSDLQTIYYSVLNYGSRLSVAEKTALCTRVKSLHAESKLNEFEKNFYLIGIYADLKCSPPVPSSVIATLEAALAKDVATAPEVFFNFFAAKAAGIALDDGVKLRVVKNLQAILKKDDSLSNLGHAFAVAAEAGGNGVLLVDRVEDAIAQADEVDGRMLQFEGGLSVTALVLGGALKLTASQKKPQPISPLQATKFATYFLSRRSVQTAKGVHVLLEALTTLNQQKAIAPVCLQVIGSGQLQPEDLQVNFRVVDLVGNAVTPTLDTVVASVSSKQGTSVVKDVKLTAKGSDKTVFGLDLKQAKPARGLYTVELTAGAFKQSMELKILGRVKVASLEVGIGDSDSSSAVKKQSVDFPNTLSTPLSADSQQKVVMKVSLVDETSGKVITVHQAFVRFENSVTGEEIVFVAEQDASKAYKFDMDVGARSGDFSHMSGKYAMELIVGDASLSNSFRWHVANFNFKFSGQESVREDTMESLYKPKQEIVHQFRVPEKRPARFVSDLFTGICCVPLLILLVVWLRLKVNISNFPLSLAAIGFHAGLGAILFLFFVFWLQLDMFTTIRYLLPLALFTFLCGNRFLRSIAAKRSAHEK
uniref:Dolichyl-diphosphooligosaccharide--protein glycosyltransferase subunit 2 n=1 Tax=Phlebotomus kandelakii TaxID=1109342 RepID=A0A6B2E9V1_9DIPT